MSNVSNRMKYKKLSIAAESLLELLIERYKTIITMKHEAEIENNNVKEIHKTQKMKFIEKTF